MKRRKDNSKKVLKVDLGLTRQDGFEHIDGRVFPFPYEDNSVTLLSSAYLVEKIDPRNKGFIKFMDECWRILKEDGQFRILTPYAGSMGYWADPTNINGCNAQTWPYFDPTSPTGLYNTYKPLPWKVDRCFFQSDGIMEVLLIKLPHDKKAK
jgi:SAM-dependent methyltransferase